MKWELHSNSRSPKPVEDDEFKRQRAFLQSAGMIASKKQIVTICWVCKEGEARQVCGGCKNVRYCSRGCQRQDWRRHKPECYGRDAGEERASS
jgi:hypothetical protein